MKNKNTKRYYLSICDNHDTGAGIFFETEPLSVISEERLNREKITRKFPKKSINLNFVYTKLNPEKIERIIIGSRNTPIFFLRLFNKYHAEQQAVSSFDIRLYLYFYFQILLNITPLSYFDSQLSAILLKRKFRKKITMVDHHLCHAYSAYSTSGFRGKSLVITADSGGDGLCLTVSIGERSNLKRIYQESVLSSISQYYRSFTEILGFVPSKDEGKVVGLAAYGNPDLLLDYMKKKLYFNGIGFNKNLFQYAGTRAKIEKELKKYKREDIAAALQKNLEEEVCKFISHWIKKTGIGNVYLAGGLFANVKLNQKVHELEEVENIFIFPHMGDGGLCIGAVMAYLQPKPSKITTLYLGLEFSDEYMLNIFKKHNLDFKRLRNAPAEIAKLLAKGKVVARFKGRMEFGPRALGNRSILYRPDDEDTINWLNKRLNRSKFMPFTPTILAEDADKCFVNLRGAEYMAKYMTITFNCTEWMKKSCPGVVHIDGTARPQVLGREDNTEYYDIIWKFKELTGLPCVLNTSFNMHGEPIVCSPEDAITSFRKSKLDYLLLNDFLIKN